MFTLGCDRAYLHAHPERLLDSEEISKYDQVLSHRAAGKPSQYITGRQEFWGMDFEVSPAVLIPRPETEHLIETLLPFARKMGKPRMVDVGTGSGAIALALAKELPGADIHATDISPEALEVARTNAERLAMEWHLSQSVGAVTGEGVLRPMVQFHQTDLLDGLETGDFDFVVSNPPYVGESEEDQVQLEVRKFEPRQAVFSGPTGLEVIERLIPQAKRALKPGGWLAMEISGTIADSVEKLLGDWSEFSFTLDLQGIRRVVMAKRA
jgi:release factor glutamine methyltransferase